MRIDDTFSILKDGRTQEYMQESMSFQIWFLAISGRPPMQKSDGLFCFYSRPKKQINYPVEGRDLLRNI